MRARLLQWLPWALLLGAAGAALSLPQGDEAAPRPMRSAARPEGAIAPRAASLPLDRSVPHARRASPARTTGTLAPPSPAPSPATSGELPPATPLEARELHLRIAHQECEDAAARFNVLSGRAPTDPLGIQVLSVCLRIGNVAWYKCIERAATREDAAACQRRFLSLDHPP